MWRLPSGASGSERQWTEPLRDKTTKTVKLTEGMREEYRKGEAVRGQSWE